jgi:predicted 2-oxoglutarate/Fe(II)-dependent dioxygenase YbiX
MNDIAGRWALPPLGLGEFAPPFAAATRTNPQFHFSTAAGRHILLGFMPRERAAREAAAAAFEAVAPLCDSRRLAAFLVGTDAEAQETTQDILPGVRWFFDPEDAVGPLYGSGAADPAWFLLDPVLRILDRAPIGAPQALFARLASLPPVEAHAGVPLVAPVLICPRVFEPEFCRRLIDYYDARGGEVSGVMRDMDGKTVGVLDNMKRRRDVNVAEDDFKREIVERLERNLLPMIRRTLQFKATRIERYLVACYDAQEGGWFQAHRDNETFGTAHRRFACSINLNAEEFEGGDLRFPEFGPRTYRPPTGGAVVFACGLQHEATPVTRGRRYAFLPFLFDEEGMRIRTENQAFVAKGDGAVIDNRQGALSPGSSERRHARAGIKPRVRRPQRPRPDETPRPPPPRRAPYGPGPRRRGAGDHARLLGVDQQAPVADQADQDRAALHHPGRRRQVHVRPVEPPLRLHLPDQCDRQRQDHPEGLLRLEEGAEGGRAGQRDLHADQLHPGGRRGDGILRAGHPGPGLDRGAPHRRHLPGAGRQAGRRGEDRRGKVSR